MYGTLYPGDPTLVIDDKPRMAAGTVVRTHDNKLWKYVRLIEQTAAIAPDQYHPVWYHDLARTEVAADYTDALGMSINNMAGLWAYADLSVAEELAWFDGAHWAFIQIGGLVGTGTAVVPCDGNAAVGDAIVGTAADNDTVHTNSGTAPVGRVLGWVVLAIAANHVGGYLTIGP